jgi:hypothetical protein
MAKGAKKFRFQTAETRKPLKLFVITRQYPIRLKRQNPQIGDAFLY